MWQARPCSRNSEHCDIHIQVYVINLHRFYDPHFHNTSTNQWFCLWARAIALTSGIPCCDREENLAESEPGFLSRWREQLTGKIKPEAGGGSSSSTKSPCQAGQWEQERGLSGRCQRAWESGANGTSQETSGDCQRVRQWVSLQTGHDLAREERTEGTVRD